MTPDPGNVKVVNLANPQTWNMYAYTTDNPTTLNDPSGLATDCGQGDVKKGNCTEQPKNAKEQSVTITYDKGVPTMKPALATYVTKVLNSAGTKSVKISATTNGKHAKHSLHYKGEAVDIHVVNGTRVINYNSNPASKTAVNAIQGAANDKGNGVARENFGPAGLFKNGVQIKDKALQRQHENHIHLATPDPSEE